MPAASRDNNSSKPSGEAAPAGKDSHLAVVAIGASAGGLAPLREFFSAFPADPTIAFVVITHLDPDHESHMVEILARSSNRPVREPGEQEPIKAGAIYTIPPGKNLMLENGRFRLAPTPRRPGISMPIDFFLRSLAKDQQERAIAVIASGTGSDGSFGIKDVKAEGGLVLVQDPNTADHDGMPRSAIATGAVDRAAPVAAMPKLILDYCRYVLRGMPVPVEQAERHLADVLTALYTRGAHDFRQYKKNTLFRRIARRMAINHIGDMADYVRFLRTDPDEVAALASDLLIGVTSFFRDPEVWEALQRTALPEMVKHKLPDASIRAWVPGCATGEEAYSVAMLLIEEAEKQQHRGQIQVFATDIDKAGLDVGRAGVYPLNVDTTVSPERLRRFFNKIGESYQVKKALRETVVFAPQNLIGDSPFSRLDLISCRNLLIYLESALQKNIFTLFHFALNEDGVLVLGTSETVSQQQQGLFSAVSKKFRIYRRTGPSRIKPIDFPFHTPELAGQVRPRRPRESEHSFADIARQMLLARYAPPSVLINRDYRVLYFHGDTQDYIAQPTGEPTNDLLALTGERLRTKLRAAVHRALTTGDAVNVGGADARRGDALPIRISVTPLRQGEEDLLLVSFKQDTPAPAATLAAGATPDDTEVIRQLEEELRRNKDELHSTIEELEASNEELKVANEEAMSMNEELQSTNEELETSKEELQSLNEELTTINNQLEVKIAELEATTNDLHNLLTSTNIATIFLDRDLHIKRFTPATSRLMRLIPSDVGRSIADIASRCTDGELLSDAHKVLAALVPVEKEVPSDTGEWYIRRVQPYRTQDNRIEGVVITYVDVTERKRHEQEQGRLAAIVESSNDAIIGRDLDGSVTTWNAGAERLFGYSANEAIGRPTSFLLPAGQPDELPAVMERLRRGESVDTFESVRQRKDGSRIDVAVTVSAVRDTQGKLIGFSDIKHDITERRRTEQVLREQKERLVEADRRKDEFLALLGHELRNPLASINNALFVLKGDGSPPDGERLRWGLDLMQRQTGRLTHLVDDLLDLARITRGRLELRRERLDLNAVVDEAVQNSQALIAQRQLDLHVTLAETPIWLEADSMRLAQVFNNLLSNAAWYTEAPGRIEVVVEHREAEASVRVRDSGMGIAPDALPRIFEMFWQVPALPGRKERGLGVGLTLVKQLVELHGGRIDAASEGAGKGSEFTVTLPLQAAHAAGADSN